MDEIIATIKTFLTSDQIRSIIRAGVVLVVGLFLARVLPKRIKTTKIPSQRIFLVQQVLRYGLVVITIIWSLREIGFDLNVLLGAAGILTVAIGFASQTSASNLISGLFLLGEQPFGVGDLIKVADVSGEVLSIDTLSVKIRTFDNLMVRVPNETMLKSNVTNFTKFPIRRIDMQIGVAYKEDVAKVKEVLLAVADRNPICLEEPKPVLMFTGYGDSALNFQFSIWGAKENFVELRTAMHTEVKEAFDKNAIEIPFPHRTVYTGAITAPFPVTVVPPASELS